MTPFDPYHKWLGIPADQQPASHYRLLGVQEFEIDADVIDTAAEQRTVFLRTFQTGPNSELAARLLNEISAARVCLLDGKSKALYDTQLRAAKQAVTEEDPLPFKTEQLAAISSKPGTRSRSRSGKPVWQQPWAISVGAVGIVVVLLLVIVFFGSGDTYISSPTTKSLPASLQMGLIAYYPFNGNANDESGNGNHGTVAGAKVTQNRFGQLDTAYDFDGVDDSISIGNQLGNFGTVPFTLSAWVKTDTDGRKDVILGKGSYGKGTGQFYFRIDEHPVKEYRMQLYLFDGTTRQGIHAKSQIKTGRWYHVVGQRDDSGMKIYIDGQLDNTEKSSPVNAQSPEPLRVGVAASFYNMRMNGAIDDVRIYNRALSAAEVKSLYEFEKP